MSNAGDLTERKARLVAQADLQRMQALLAWHEVRAVVSPPRRPSTPGSRAFSIASKVLAIAIPIIGIGKMRRALRYVSLGMTAMRIFKSWRG